MCLFSCEKYLNRVRGFCHDDETIKVITGVRRCGGVSAFWAHGVRPGF